MDPRVLGRTGLKVSPLDFGCMTTADAITNTLKQEGAMLAATKWVLKNRSVDTAIVCMTNFDQLDENLRALWEPSSDSDQKLIAAQLAYIRPLYYRMYGHTPA